MKRKKMISIVAVVLAVLMVLSLMASIIPMAHAISQSDIDALREQKNAAAARAAEAEERLASLQEQESTVLDKRRPWTSRTAVPKRPWS